MTCPLTNQVQLPFEFVSFQAFRGDDQLLNDGHDVRILDNLENVTLGGLANAAGISIPPPLLTSSMMENAI